MATYKLKYTGAQIDERLKAVDNMTTDGTKTSFSGDLEVNSNILVNSEVINFIYLFAINDSYEPTTIYSFEKIKELLLQNRLNGFIDNENHVYYLSVIGKDPNDIEAISLISTYFDAEESVVVTEFRFLYDSSKTVATVERRDKYISSGM